MDAGAWPRCPASKGWSAEGSPLPWLPLSMNPAGTISHLASLLPPLAIGAAILSRPAADANGLRWLIPLVAAGVAARSASRS